MLTTSRVSAKVCYLKGCVIEKVCYCPKGGLFYKKCATVKDVLFLKVCSIPKLC